MEPISKSPSRAGRMVKWLFVAAGLFLVPFVVLAIVAASYLTLDRDARFLKTQMLDGTDIRYQTDIQFSVGTATINAVRFALGFTQDEKITDARKMLDSINHASVGVYQLKHSDPDKSCQRLWITTDQAMLNRGWLRLVGVVDKNDAVVIYVPVKPPADTMLKTCLAVFSGNHLVVASAHVDTNALVDVVEGLARDHDLRYPHLASILIKR